MSRHPGIGKPWLEKYKSDVYNFDHVILNGVRMKPPKSYDLVLKKLDPQLHTKIWLERKSLGRKREHDETPERLLVRHEIQLKKAERLERKI